MECRHGWLTLTFPSASSCSLIPFLSVYLRLLPLSPGSSPPSFLPSSLALLFYISSFRLLWLLRPRTIPSRRWMMGSSPQLSQLFIINADPHHIFLTLGRWFSHWTALLTCCITNQRRGTLSQTHTNTHPHTKWHSQEITRHYMTLQIYKLLKCYIVF